MLIRDRLVTQAVWREAQAVLLFYPMALEPAVWPLAEVAWRAGKVVALPRHDQATNSYVAARINDVEGDLAPGRFGIREPRPECPPVNRLDLALVPGLGFTLDGGRLGRGRGYFDRLLAAIPGFKCGVGFDCQVALELPLQPHDVRLNCILTPTRWHLTAGRARS